MSISKRNEIGPGINLKIENHKKVDVNDIATSGKDNKVLKTPCICGWRWWL